MKKILLGFSLFIACFVQLNAQNESVTNTLAVFPYQQKNEAAGALSTMQSWNKTNWNALLVMLDDDSLKLKASYALNAYVNSIANEATKQKQTATILANGFTSNQSFYAKAFIIEQLGLLGDDAAVKLLSKLLSDEVYVGNAARALASIRTEAAMTALHKALTKAKEPAKRHIQVALNTVNNPLPELKIRGILKPITQNDVQSLLLLQDRLVVAKNPLTKKNILSEASYIKSFSSFMFVSKSLNDPEVNQLAALIITRLALTDPSIKGPIVREALEKALPLIKGVDSAILVKNISALIKAMPYDNGFVSLFNEKDLSGWKGLVGNPISRSKMGEKELQDAQIIANEKMKGDWIVKDGLLVFTGHGENLCTTKPYGDFELFVDWKITEKGDAGIYLRGSPQVQIWDTSRREVGAQVGSGGLYNNQVHQSKPLVVADNQIGEWNTFHIRMQGEKVTVYLNGQLVTDNVVLENYWDRKLAIFSKEQIELQAHGTYVAYRNIYLREIPATSITMLTEEEKKQGFTTLFDGSTLDQWTGNTTGYRLEDGAIVTHPELGGIGNLFTKKEYADFEYHFEFQLTPGANNGLGIHAPLEGDAAYVGIELQILDNEAEKYKNLQPSQYHGSVYGVIPAKRGYLKPTGEWNQETVVVKGTKVKVILNEQVILDGDTKEAASNGTLDHKEHPGLLRTSGHIGFLGHGDVVRFKNIRVKSI